MALSEKELDRIIRNHFSKELEATIEVPDIDSQWEKIKHQILETESIPTKQKTLVNRKRIIVAATILVLIGSMTLSSPYNANALGGKIAEFFSYVVGKTTQNKTETYRQEDIDVPIVEEKGDIFEKEVTLEQAQASVPFNLATPGYLPDAANIRKVILAAQGEDVYQITIEYNIKENVIIFSQQISGNGISQGTLYDTDDTVVKELSINGSHANLFMSKNGINTVNWQIRGLFMQLKGKIDEEEIIKIANSIK